MKTSLHSHPAPAPTEEDIREYAYHLYAQSGFIPDRDLDNWLEAEACLCARISKAHSHSRLRRHLDSAGDAPAISRG